MKFFLLFLLSFSALAQSPWFYGSGSANNLENAIQYKNLVKNITGSLDPSSSAVNAPKGSVYESTNGNWYVKQDAGSSTNWSRLLFVGGAVATIGTIDSVTKSADGAFASGSSIYMQTADASFPGILSLTDQAIVGFKTFSSTPRISSLSTGVAHFDASGNLTSSLIVNADVNAAANIDATKLVTGIIDNDEFNTLNGITTTQSIQAQLDGKQATGNYITALTGDGTAVGPGNAVFTLATTGAIAATYTNMTATIDAKGRILSAANGAVGVTSLTANSPLSTNATTGAVTISHDVSGVTANTYNWANVVVDTFGHLTGASSNPNPVTQLNGTANQVIVSATSGAITASLPQDIAITSTPTFSGILLTGLSADLPVQTDPLKNLISLALDLTSGTRVSGKGNISASSAAINVSGGTNAIIGSGVLLDLPDQLAASSCTSCNLTYNSKGIITVAASGGGAGVSTITGTANQITTNTSTGAVTLSLATDVAIVGNFTATSQSISNNTTTQSIVVTDLTASYPTFTNADKKLISKKVDLTADVVGVLPGGNGGTGAATSGGIFFVDANIYSASLNIALGTANVASYTGIEGTDLTVEANTSSAAVKIACSGTNTPSGTTCSSGSESLGIEFTNADANGTGVCGVFEACITAHHSGNVNNNGDLIVTTSMFETGVSNQVVISDGHAKDFHRIDESIAGSTTISGKTLKPCGIFRWSSKASRVVRLMYEQQVSNANNSTIFLERDAARGQYDTHVTIFPKEKTVCQ